MENNVVSGAPVAIVTGAAGGIGEAICRRFGETGVRVVATGRSADKLARLKAALEPSMQITTIAVDVTANDAPKRIVDHALEAYGQLDHLVNNAGAGVWGLVHETTDEMLDEVLNTSLRAPFRLCREALPHMREGSCIINTTSVTAYKGSPQLLDYSATKGAIVAFTRSLSQSLVTRGVRVNGVAPGPIWTPLIPATFPPEKVATFGADVPMQRSGQPEEVAPCYVFLASDDSSYMAGQILHPNGGEVING